MPSEVQARFQALMVLRWQLREVDEEFEREKRLLKLKHSTKIQAVYKRRAAVV